MFKNISRRQFCKCCGSIFLSTFIVNFAKANSDKNQLMYGNIVVNGKKINENSQINFDDLSEVETKSELAFIQNNQNGFLVRPNSKLKFFKNKIQELVKGSVHGVFGKQSSELQIKTPRGTIGIRGTVTYIEYEESYDRTYVCNCYGNTVIYNSKMQELKKLNSKYHSPVVIDKNQTIKASPYDIPLNHYDDNIKSIENKLGRKPRWKLPEGKMIFFAPTNEKIKI